MGRIAAASPQNAFSTLPLTRRIGMKLEGYHACLTLGGASKVVEEGPFRSEVDTFLGKGYYLWEGYKEHGIWWGDFRIRKKHWQNYYVLECVVEFDDNSESGVFLDLHGRYSDRKLMEDLIKEASDLGYYNDELTLGNYIDWLRELNAEKPGIFPFRVIRAIDATNPDGSENAVLFKPGSSKRLDLRPRVMICFHQKMDVHLHSVKVVHTKV